MLFRYRKRMNRNVFDWLVRGIRQTPPLKRSDGPLTFLSMLQHDDMNMYLLAIKSLYRRIGEGQILILDDGTLTDQDRAILDHHLDRPRIMKVADVDPSPCPRGSCWERLCTAISESQDRYVIQVDSDIVAKDVLTDVARCYKDNRSFTLGTRLGQRLWSFPETSEFANRHSKSHVQHSAERVFARLPNAEERKYVRGCAGFSGFARGQFSFDRLAAFSREMENQLGQKWHEWGSEQVASNIMIANADDPLVLRPPKYTNHYPDTDLKAASLIHFIGPYRFYRQRYAAIGRALIKDDLA